MPLRRRSTFQSNPVPPLPRVVSPRMTQGTQASPSPPSSRQWLVNGPQPSSLRAGGVGDTPNRAFGGQARERSQSNTHSGDSRPSASDDGTRPSRSDTTSSRDTYHSTRAAYGVGEAGGDEQFSALIRTLSPEQRRQQEELGRMSQQRDVASSASNSTGLTSQIVLASPSPPSPPSVLLISRMRPSWQLERPISQP